MEQSSRTKNINILELSETIVVVIVWIIAFIVPVLNIDGEDSNIGKELLHILLSLLPFVILFAINHVVLIPKLLFRKKWLCFSICNIVLVALITLLVSLTLKNRWSHADKPGREPRTEAPSGSRPNPEKHHHRRRPPMEGAMVLLSILLVGCNVGIRLGFRYLKIQHINDLKDKQYSENKLVFLKQQVSPHFFMNTLNNIHALIDIDQELAKEAVIRLSKLMRYMLYGCDSGMSKIGKEVEFITSYVELMRLRYSDKVDIATEISGSLPTEKMIPSLIFVSIIENAFKHGISYRDESFVRISLCEQGDSKLVFRCDNSVPKTPAAKADSEEGGIGIMNTIKQLDLIYGKDYELVMDKNEIFTVKLTIPL